MIHVWAASNRISARSLFARPETTSEFALREFGFSEPMIDRFFRPFLGGVMLDRTLRPSSRMLEFVFRMFARGDATLPALGMGAIPEQAHRGYLTAGNGVGSPLPSARRRRRRHEELP
jgi:hypothetical protein